MSRVKRGVQAHRKHKDILDKASGYYGARSRVFRVAKQAVIKAAQYSYRDRKAKKRDFRSLWITRINGALYDSNITYSVFMNSLKQLNIMLNRKMLAELAVHNSQEFYQLVEQAIKFQANASRLIS